MSFTLKFCEFIAVFCIVIGNSYGFIVCNQKKSCQLGQLHALEENTIEKNIDNNLHETTISRRAVFRNALVAVASFNTVLLRTQQPALAAQRQALDELLYRILRVREATQQETRLIKSGKFKDVQRANVKLAVRFMVDNYRLNDAFVGASAYLDGNARRVEAGQIGQSTVQNLYTILEYFDSSDVENIKVGQASMAGKEDLVLRGLEATRKGIDDFLSYFPASEVDKVKERLQKENELNVKEFDPSLGDLLNMPELT